MNTMTHPTTYYDNENVPHQGDTLQGVPIGTCIVISDIDSYGNATVRNVCTGETWELNAADFQACDLLNRLPEGK